MATKIKTIWHHLGTHGYGQLGDHLALIENCKYNSWALIENHKDNTLAPLGTTGRQLGNNFETTVGHL